MNQFNSKTTRISIFIVILPLHNVYHMTALHLHSSRHLDIYSAQTDTELALHTLEGVQAGFPSPAADFVDLTIDLNRHLIRHPSATFYARAKGNSMSGAGIADGDLLIVDKSLEPANDKIAVCYLDGEFTVKRIRIDLSGVWLMPENADFEPIRIQEDNSLVIWGIVTHIIKRV